MKTRIALILSGLLVSCGSALSQQPANPATLPYFQRQQAAKLDDSQTRFDLDFPGGTPGELVRAIEKASGTPVNVVIPSEHSNVRLPPLKMKSVTVPQLFTAITEASTKTTMLQMASGTYQQYVSGYGFRTVEPPTDRAVWHFYDNAPILPLKPSTCRFYQLAPYLETYKVEDITTAIQTGWKMLGETNPPSITYHKDTKLLIAVGEQNKLMIIDEVLRQLSNPTPKPDARPSQPKAAATEKPAKAE